MNKDPAPQLGERCAGSGATLEVVLNVKLNAVSAAVSVFAKVFALKVFPCGDNHRVIFINTHMHTQVCVCACRAVTCDAVITPTIRNHPC